MVPCLQLLACEDMGISLDDLKQYASAEVKRAICCWLSAEHSTEHAAWVDMPGHAITTLRGPGCGPVHLALCSLQLPGHACWPLSTPPD